MSSETIRIRFKQLGAALLCAFALVACRGQANLRTHYEGTRGDMRDGKWDKVVASLKGAKDKTYKESDRVMYWLNLGTAQHYAGQYDDSTQTLAQAEQTMRDLWTVSVSSEASKYLLNESTQDYPGDDHEKALLYVYTALNRLAQGRTSDALVEARRADEWLKEVKVAREKEHEVGTLYGEDAFVLWLVGLLYEEEGSLQDALIAYQASEKTYREIFGVSFQTPTPHYVYEDILRVATVLGRTEVADDVRARDVTDGASIAAREQGLGEVVVIHAVGESPYKKDKYIHAPLPSGYLARVAIPELVTRNDGAQGVRVSAGADAADSELAESVRAIAVASYNHRLPAITGRAVARAAIKYGATQGAKAAAEGKGKDEQKKRPLLGAVVGLVGNIGSVATEHADLRSWTLLPAGFHVARLWLPPGEHTLQISGVGQRKVTVRKQARTFVSLRSL